MAPFLPLSSKNMSERAFAFSDLSDIRNTKKNMPKRYSNRHMLRDAAHRFLPVALAVFLVILTTTLLATTGRLPHGALVGFCATSSVLVVVYTCCWLALLYGRDPTLPSDAEKAPVVVAVENPVDCEPRLGGFERTAEGKRLGDGEGLKVSSLCLLWS